MHLKVGKYALIAITLLFGFTSDSESQSINGVPNQVMSGFTAGVGGAPILATVSNYLGNTGSYTYDVHVRLLRLG